VTIYKLMHDVVNELLSPTLPKSYWLI